jgi:hypothetical protein
MKTPLDALNEMTTLGWSMFLGNQPAAPATAPARQAANVQEWKGNGGSVKKMLPPRAKKAAPARKRKPSRTAKGKARK